MGIDKKLNDKLEWAHRETEALELSWADSGLVLEMIEELNACLVRNENLNTTLRETRKVQDETTKLHREARIRVVELEEKFDRYRKHHKKDGQHILNGIEKGNEMNWIRAWLSDIAEGKGHGGIQS